MFFFIIKKFVVDDDDFIEINILISNKKRKINKTNMMIVEMKGY
jgi:hypothetical protein